MYIADAKKSDVTRTRARHGLVVVDVAEVAGLALAFDGS